MGRELSSDEFEPLILTDEKEEINELNKESHESNALKKTPGVK